MFQEQNQKTLEIMKRHEENVTSIINDKISSINQRLDKLTLDINNNLTIINELRGKTKDLTLSLETSQNTWKTENKKLKEELTNLRSDLKEKDVYLKNKENEGLDVTEEKLKKVFKDELDIDNVVNERAHRVTRNNGNNENNDQTRKPPTFVAKLLHLKDKQDILHEAKSRKFLFQRRFFKRNFSNKKKTLK